MWRVACTCIPPLILPAHMPPSQEAPLCRRTMLASTTAEGEAQRLAPPPGADETAELAPPPGETWQQGEERMRRWWRDKANNPEKAAVVLSIHCGAKRKAYMMEDDELSLAELSLDEAVPSLQQPGPPKHGSRPKARVAARDARRRERNLNGWF